MKKILSVLLAVSIMATPLVSRVSVATWEYEEEKLPQEAEKEQSWFQKVLNETKKAGTAGWLSAKEFANIAFKGAAWLYELAATNPEFSIVTALQILIIFTIVHAKNKFFGQMNIINEAAKNLNKNSETLLSIIDILQKMVEDTQTMITNQELRNEFFGKSMERLQEELEEVIQVIGNQCKLINEKEGVLDQTMKLLSGLIQEQPGVDLVGD